MELQPEFTARSWPWCANERGQMWWGNWRSGIGAHSDPFFHFSAGGDYQTADVSQSTSCSAPIHADD